MTSIDMTNDVERDLFTLLQLRGRLKVEIATGLKFRSGSSWVQAKRYLGISGSRERVLAQIQERIDKLQRVRKARLIKQLRKQTRAEYPLAEAVDINNSIRRYIRQIEEEGGKR